MRSRLLTSALLAYLALDFGNPLIPGAVTFVAGEFEAVEGAQHRSPDTPTGAVAATPRADAIQPVERRAPGATAARPPVRWAAPFAPRSRPSASSGDSTPSPGDD